MAVDEIIKRLERSYSSMVKHRPRVGELKKSTEFQKDRGMKGWEAFFVPEKEFYEPIMAQVSRDDVVLDAGAGDLRFALMLSERCKKVYAVEINPEILGIALSVIGHDLPRNVIPVCANAFEWGLPADVTAITCLMIHRQHEFPGYWLNQCKILFTDRVDNGNQAFMLQGGMASRLRGNDGQRLPLSKPIEFMDSMAQRVMKRD